MGDMESAFYNFSHTVVENGWDRWTFMDNWRRLYARDPRWVPPYYPAFRRLINPARNPHLERMESLFVYTTAVSRPVRSRRGEAVDFMNGIYTGISSDNRTSATALLYDPRRTDADASLALLHLANDAKSLERLLDSLAVPLAEWGCRRLLAPTGLSPYLGSGLLLDSWDHLPPLHTPYDPPYLPDLLANFFQPLEEARLVEYDPQAVDSLAPAHPSLTVAPADPARLTTDLLPVLASSAFSWRGSPPPDALEAAYLLEALAPWPLRLLLAEWEGIPAGLLLLQPDQAALQRRLNGGAGLFNRLLLPLVVKSSARQGRILFWGVLPQFRGLGIGGHLLREAEKAACAAGWERLTLGPLPEQNAAAALHFGGRLCQTYALYGINL